MAIVTDSIVDVGSYTTFNIGLSKAISNYTADEVWDFPYCSSQWEYYKHIGNFPETMWDFAPGGTGEGTNKLFPLKFVGRNAAYYPQTYNFDPGEIEYNNPDGIYCRVIWLYGSDEQISNLLTGKRRSIYATDGFKIVTQMDMTKVFIFLDNFRTTPFGNNVNINDINTLNYDNFKIKEEHDGTTSYSHPRNCSIFPVVMFKYNDKLHLHLLFQRLYESLDWSWGVHSAQNETRDKIQGYEWGAQPCSFDGSQGCYLPVNIARDFVGLRPQNVESFHTATDIIDVGAMYQWHYYAQTGGRINPITEQAYLKLASWYGGMFYHNGTYYKPIIEDGYVTGYTDDMTYPSDIDNWTDTTKHDVPPSPPGPGPGPSGDDIDQNSFGGGSKLGGVDNLWLLTAQQLADLHTAMNNNNDPNFEPLNSIISVLGLAISPLYIFGDDISTLTNISIKKADGTSWSSGVNGHICSSQVSSFGLTGNISIQRKYNNFLDYPPYASHEIFLPLCGWIPLPSCCVGRKLSVYYVPDIQTGGVRGLVLCDGCIVGEKYGILGANIPFTSNGHGLMLGGIISGGVQTLADFATAMGGLATGNAMATVYGGSSFFSDGFNMALAANQNRTSVIGQNQDRTGFSDGTIIRIKSVYQDVKIDPLFGHTIGYLCHESGTLNNFHGFTVCENPHVHISATSAEKEEIKRLLEEGVILPAASE